MTLTNSFMLALACHAMAFSLITITFKGTPRDYGLEFFFWGSIVRKEELAPSRSRSLDVPERSSVALPRNENVRFLVWGKGFAVDKPDMKSSQRLFTLPDPVKFSGPRETWDGSDEQGGEAKPVELPVPPNVKLRYPRS